MKTYNFKEVSFCEMCGDKSDTHKIMGQRLNKSQGFNPKRKTGVTVSVQQCTQCLLVYSNPQPIPANLQDHYGTPPEEYWNDNYFTWHPNYFSYQIDEAKELLNFAAGMRALDIGAGLGKAMLSLQHAGFDVYGLEPSIPFFERAISKMGIETNKLKLSAIEEIEYENDTFDFITFGAVFEHLYEPSKCLKKALRWLKPGGIIHIEVPSSRWFIAKLMNFYFKLRGTNYVTNLSPMHTPFHLHEFDLKSFEHLSTELNFKIEKFRFEVCSIYYFPKLFHGILKRYMKSSNTGMQLTVYLRKQ